MFAEGNYRRRKRMRRHAYKPGLHHGHGGFGFKSASAAAAAAAAAAASWPSSAVHVAAAAAAMSSTDIYGRPYNFSHYGPRSVLGYFPQRIGPLFNWAFHDADRGTYSAKNRLPFDHALKSPKVYVVVSFQISLILTVFKFCAYALTKRCCYSLALPFLEKKILLALPLSKRAFKFFKSGHGCFRFNGFCIFCSQRKKENRV